MLLPVQVLPGVSSFVFMRTLRLVPSPHAAEQGLQWPQLPHLQVAGGHACVAQLLESSPLSVHGCPPWRSSSRARVRRSSPPPQVALQALQGTQSAQRQSTGQAVPHARCSVRVTVHGLSPVACTAARRRSDVPLQGAEHADQAPQSPQWQSAGHVCAPQRLSSLKALPQGNPPSRSCTTTRRVRMERPPPQLLLQRSHSPQADHLQSTGHACVLHVCLW
mmetsp:Transcript_44698/g.127558  ORF Transcript_44698/g.127558 Transcript_44698/m.127558 type:complete len:220 (+) Transcript_44698:133-792(+)